MSTLLWCADCGRVMLEIAALVSPKGKVCGRCFGAQTLTPTAAQITQLDDMVRFGIIDELTRRRLIYGAHPDLPDAWLKPLSKLDDRSVTRTLATDRELGQRLQQIQDQQGRDFAAAGKDYERFVTETAAGMIQAAELETAKKHIAELEETVEAARSRCEFLKREADIACDRATKASERAARNGDRAGAYLSERDDLLRENAVLRRKLEAVERKAGKR